MSPALAGKFQPPDHQGRQDLILLSEMRMEPDWASFLELFWSLQLKYLKEHILEPVFF